MDLRKLIDENVECVDTPNGKYLNREQVFESIKLVEEKLKSPNTTKAEIKPCENDNCVNYSEDYDYNCCYFMDCKERV